MLSSALRSPSPFARRLALRAGFALVLSTASACANSDKPAQPQPDKPATVSPDAKPQAKVADEKTVEAKLAAEIAAAEKAAAEKAAAEKAAADKAAADKALVKEPEPKAADGDKGDAKAKAPGDQPKEVAAVAPKSTDTPKSTEAPRAAGLAKPTKLEPKTGILAKGEADKYVKSGAKPVVRLLDAGAEPRSAASYAIAKGAVKPLQMDMDLEMAMEAAGMKLPATKMPTMVLLFNFTTGDRAGAEWPIDGKLSKISVTARGETQDQIAAGLRPQLQQLEGLGMNYFVDEKGRIRDVKVTLPPALPPMAGQMMSGMTQSVESMTSPLPNEAIGIGAKWEVLSRIVANGADLLQVSTFTLEKRNGDVLSLNADVRQFAAKEAVNPPGMPKGATARLLSYKCQGGGKPVFDLTDVAPTNGSMSIQSSMSIELKMDVEGQSEKQTTSVDTKMTASYSRPAP